jgi:haloalkane dehalogenase
MVVTTAQPNKNTIERPQWLPEEAWQFEIKTAHIDVHQVAYTDEGEGPVLLLVHDGMWSYIWGQLIEWLREEYRVVTLDFPGSGLSPASDHPTSIKEDSALLEKFVDHLGLDPLALVLHDLGGSVGVGLAARRPESIEGMDMTNTFAWRPHVASLEFMLTLMTSRAITALDVSTNLVPKMTSTNFGVGRHLDEAGRQAFLGGFLEKSQRLRFHHLMESAKR